MAALSASSDGSLLAAAAVALAAILQLVLVALRIFGSAAHLILMLQRLYLRRGWRGRSAPTQQRGTSQRHGNRQSRESGGARPTDRHHLLHREILAYLLPMDPAQGHCAGSTAVTGE